MLRGDPMRNGANWFASLGGCECAPRQGLDNKVQVEYNLRRCCCNSSCVLFVCKRMNMNQTVTKHHTWIQELSCDNCCKRLMAIWQAIVKKPSRYKGKKLIAFVAFKPVHEPESLWVTHVSNSWETRGDLTQRIPVFPDPSLPRIWILRVKSWVTRNQLVWPFHHSPFILLRV